MTTIVLPRTAISADEIYSASNTAEKPLGETIQLVDEETKQVSTFVYVKAAASIKAHTPCVLTTSSDGIKALAPSTDTVAKKIGVPQTDLEEGSFGYVCIKGPCKALVGAVAAANSQVQAVNGGKKFLDAGTKETIHSQAVCGLKIEAASAGADGFLTTIVLIGKAVPITAAI